MTETCNGAGESAVAPPAVGIAEAEMLICPRRLGFQEQVAMIFGDVPEVDLLMHPGILIPLALNVTFDAMSKFALMLIGVL